MRSDKILINKNSSHRVGQVCIYCASSSKINQKYFEGTIDLTNLLVDHHIKIVYGGGSVGLMGIIADTVLSRNGEIKGIIPHFMKDVEWDHKGVKEMEVVSTMHERKNRFLIDTDALICLPGGSGTFEELLEAITLKKLGKLTIPIIIVNIDGYYDPLIQLFERAITEKFMGENHRNLWIVINDPKDIIKSLTNAEVWTNGIHHAKV